MSLTAALVAGGGALLGGVLSGNAAKDAARTSANAQLQSAQIAADAAKFRPVGMTNTFGTSKFGFDDQGYLNEASYTLSPQLKGYQDFLAGQGAQSQQDVQGLLSLGRGYLAQSPEQVRTDYIARQNALLAPQNEQAYAQLQNRLFNTGRGGLATGATTAGGMGATNPELAAYYNSLAQQQAQLAAGAEQAAQQQVAFGQGLLSSAYSPLQSNIGLQGTIEQLGQDPLTLGANLGGRTMQGGGTAAQALMQGGTNADRTLQAANAYSPLGSALSGFAQNPQATNALGSWITGTNTFKSQATPQLSNQVSSLGSSTSNPWSDYNTGANGWGNYGE
jgi:hypothetical protein